MTIDERKQLDAAWHAVLEANDEEAAAIEALRNAVTTPQMVQASREFRQALKQTAAALAHFKELKTKLEAAS